MATGASRGAAWLLTFACACAGDDGGAPADTDAGTSVGPSGPTSPSTTESSDGSSTTTAPTTTADTEDTAETQADTEPEPAAVAVRLWNVTMGIADPRFDTLPASLSTVQLTPEVTLLAEAPPDAVSVRFTLDEGAPVVDAAAPFRLSEDARGEAVAIDLTVGTHTLVVEAFASPDATGDPIASADVPFEITRTGTLEAPAEHATHRLWRTESGLYIHRDENGDFLDSDDTLVFPAGDVSAVDMGGGQVHLVVSDPSDSIVFAFIVLLPDGFDPAVPYPLVVFFHHGFEGYRGTDNDGLPLDEPQLGGPRSITEAEEQRTRFPAIVLVPQMRQVQDIDGVVNEWAAFSSISNDTGSFVAGPEPSINMTPVLDVIDALEDNALVIDGATPTIDPARIYVSGHSMGGLGTWDLLGRFPDRWAAGIPMAGYSDHATAPDLVDTPIWAFHHEIDCYNPVIGTQTMYDLITNDNGGTRMRFTELTFDTGGACDQAHFQTPNAAWNDEPGLFEWIFGQVDDRIE